MSERWLLPHTTDFYVRDEDIRDLTWQEGPEPDRFSVRITFTHPSVMSKQFDEFTWSEIIAFARRGVRIRKAAPD